MLKNIQAAAMGNGGEIYVLDMGEPVKIVELAQNMIKLCGLVPHQDVDIVLTGQRPGEKLYEELINKNEQNIPAHHQKIMIPRVITYPFDFVEQAVRELVESKEDDVSVVKRMKEIVPEFKSNNSVYEKLENFNLLI